MAKQLHLYDKVWVSRNDSRTRDSHRAAHGQRVPFDEAFLVGGHLIDYPGQDGGPPGEVKNCRCYIRIEQANELVLVGSVEQETEMAEEDTQDEAETFTTFSGVIGKLGVATSDRRILASDIDANFREFPLPLAWCEKAGYGHQDSYTVGVIEFAEIRGEDVYAEGYWLNDLGDHVECATAQNQVNHRVSAPSLDLAAAEYIFTDENGKEIEGDLFDWWEENGEPYSYFTKAEVTGFTLVQTPAFDGIDIVNGERETRDVAITAAVVDGPKLQAYGAHLFEDPKLTRATAPTMDNTTGRIYGHLAEWGHVLRGGRDVAPRNHNGYLNFHTSQVLLDNGKQLSVGRLTVKGGHAPTTQGVSAATARAHYDNACTAFGLVRVGEDAFGIWFSGVPAPGVDSETFQMGMTCQMSGDWRDCGQGRDMIGAHAVNNGGFPIYSACTDANGREIALVASIAPTREKSKKSAAGGLGLSRDDLRDLLLEVQRTAYSEREAEDARLAADAARKTALARAEAVIGKPPTHAEKISAAVASAGL